ncbi:hydrogenase expression/formation protein [Pseudolabrys sp. FHR47]|uniref:hydrogenase expression/formation protein n=1 Tax=Pseudolabrys sp. FHR47 TaxID=2562284 RepID=UPI0010BF0E35|nr:hydrogenase expression/formation protein [Pseudolabrys sp. FHR47]
MRVGFWSEAEEEEMQATILPVGHEGGEGRRGVTAAGAIAALASADSAELARQCPAAAALLPQLAAALSTQRAAAPSRAFTLQDLNDAERQLIADVLGEGEVSGLVALPDGRVAQIQESVLAGLWRVRVEGEVDARDYVEIGAVPEIVLRAALDFTAPAVALGDAPADAMNVMPVLAEIRERMAAHRPGARSHVINFTLLPMNEADMAHLQQSLGNGPIQLFSRGYGTCRVLATGARHVWSVQFTNAMDTVILDTLEIGDVPEVARAADEDFEDSAERLTEIIEAYF